MPARPWIPPPAEPSLGAAVVHVWRTDLRVDDAALARLVHLLADDERERAARFRLSREHRRFVAARGWLRTVLARYARCEAGALRLEVGPDGKPRLGQPRRAPLEFSLSHSGDCAVLAVSDGRRVGVDVEAIRGDFVWDGIAAQLFTARELRRLARLASTARTVACFRRWTRMEAWVKARGEGLAAFPTLRRPPWVDAWSVRALDVAEGYAAALAAEGRGWRVVRYESAESGRARKFIPAAARNSASDSARDGCGGQPSGSMRYPADSSRA